MIIHYYPKTAMKKQLLLLALVSFFASLASAQAPRRVLVEELTSSTCPPCAATDPFMEEFEQDYLDKVCVLKWHVNWPNPGNDPFYLNFKGGRTRSIGYYENTGVPHVMFNGLNGIFPQSVALLKSAVDDAMSQTSPFTVDIQQTVEGDSMIVNLTVKAVGEPPTDNDLRLAVVLAERFAAYKGTNGVPFHTSAVRSVIPGLTGSGDAGGAIDVTSEYPAFSIALGETKTYRYAGKIGSSWNRDQLMAVAFIQSEGSREVFQANWTVPMVTFRKVTPGPVMVGSAEDYQIEVHNKGTTPVTLNVNVAAPTAPTEWGLTAAGLDGGQLAVEPDEIKVVTINSAQDIEAYGLSEYTLMGSTVGGIGAGGVVGYAFGVDSRDIIVNAGTLSATKLGQVERAFTAYGYRPTTIEYGDFDEVFLGDWSRFRTIFYLADNKFGSFSNTGYLPFARNFMDMGGNLLLSSSILVGGYYDASVQQGNDVFITSMQDNLNITPEESVEQTAWGSLEGISGDPISSGLTASITGMATVQRLTPFNTIDGSPIFKNENGDVVGLKSVMGDGKMVYLSFGFDKIATKDSTVRKAAISKILDWFAGVASVRVSDNATSVAVTNAPNPVAEMTKFTYSITEPTVVSLAVYDVMGREVARVVSNESHSMGTYEAEFDASKLANGNYTYVIFAGEQKVTGTMIVQK